ncbi:DUF726 domain-containing protein [uncultured Tateyamaria sp.]|uniref:DUF726 domain-containing protein n=1 Tax=uncultured Tateyamaria sp. TaxID=455651 RepID=UPI0026018314|nr:DUF726 domain-containing protein [uncultured Tateyamaria sp.]
MPILRVNAGPEGLCLDRSPAAPASALRSAARGTGPIIILIHGFKYDPTCPRHSPHSRIFAHRTHPDKPGDVAWLRHLGFGIGDADEGLAIAFGWRARGHIWAAHASAKAAGRQLADMITDLHRHAPTRPIHVMTHSMGSEVIFEALRTLPAHSIRRIVTITGASYASSATAALQSRAGCAAELINITSRENDLFDFMYERLIAPPVPFDRAMGCGFDLPNAVTIQLDCAHTLARLSRFGGHVAPARARVCHWSGYTRPGALRFYAHCLRTPKATPLAALQHAVPADPAPRWSRLFARPDLGTPLPMAQKPAS